MASYAEGLNILRSRERRQAEAGRQRRIDAAARSGALSIRSQSRRHRRGMAARQRDRLMAARPDRGGVHAKIRSSRSSKAASPIRARAVGRSRPRSTKRSRLRFLRRRCTSDSVRAAKPSSPTRSSRPCATSSAAIWNSIRMPSGESDALVFFGATGDLAYKKIFPALQAMVKHKKLDVPVIGVAKAGWNLDQLKARARDSVTEHGGIDAPAFEKLMSLLQYVDGDYGDRATFDTLRKTLGNAKHPAHYLAIPPALFETVVEQLGQSHCADGARVIVEKPFGHDLASAQELNRILHSIFDESAVFRIDHYLGKRPVHNLLFFRFSNPLLESFWNQRIRRERSNHDGRELRRRRARIVLRRHRRDQRRDREPHVSGAFESCDGSAGAIRQRAAAQREGEGARGSAGDRNHRRRSRSVRRLSQRERRRAGLQDRNVCCRAAVDQLLALEGHSVLHSRRQESAGDRIGVCRTAS